MWQFEVNNIYTNYAHKQQEEQQQPKYLTLWICLVGRRGEPLSSRAELVK